jgi:hypothetical protein
MGAITSLYFGDLVMMWRAAGLIQRVWRGYRARRQCREFKKSEEVSKHSSEDKQLHIV